MTMEKITTRTSATFAALAVLAFVAAGRPAGAREAADTVSVSLDRAIELGLTADETLAQAGEGVRSAEAMVREARSGMIPRLDLSARYGRNIMKPVLFIPSEMGEAFGGVTKIELGEDNEASAAAAATWNIWTAGRVSSAVEAARAMAEAARRGREATEDYVVFNVMEAYYGALLAGANLEISEMALASAAEAARVARAGFEEGTVSRFDLLRAEVELENRRAPLVAARNELDRAMLVLKRRCGLGPETRLVLTDDFGPVDPPEDPGTLMGMMAGSNPELAALQHRVEAARMSLEMEKAERWPALQLGANYILQSQWSGDPLPDDDNLAHSAAVTIGLNYPLFDGFRARARIVQAKADLRSAELEYERVMRQRELDVRVSRLELENAIEALRGRKEAVELAEEAHRLALVRMRNGLATPLERLDAELALTTARGQHVAALYAVNMAEAALELTAGTISGGSSGEGRRMEGESR